jgi:hypothetical protein
MAYGSKPSGNAKPGQSPYGGSFHTEMVSAKGKLSKEWNKGPMKGTKKGPTKGIVKGGR